MPDSLVLELKSPIHFVHLNNMATVLIESVANISEGQDRAKIDRIAKSVSSTENCKLLHVDSNADANRTVLTFVGNKSSILEAAKNLLEAVSREIDISCHQGVHPRVGALDVCPFIPLKGSNIEECKAISSDFAAYASEHYSLPVFLYRDSQSSDHRKHLSQIRKGSLEGLASRMETPQWQPDFGPNVLHPELGAVVSGARNILIAFNLSLSVSNIGLAKKLAKLVRDEFKSVRAIGWEMQEYGCSQISCNLEDYKETGVEELFQFSSRLAKEEGVEIGASELIGLIPFEALVGSSFPECREAAISLVNRAAGGLKLANFIPDKRVVELTL